jgi:catechol 2,3-dioxygenase-like lactoylglutathione lyase family enzyme
MSSTTEDGSSHASGTAKGGGADMRLEVLVVPVSDAERAKEFYSRIGWRLDADITRDDSRLIQFTPPGSGCSVQFGTNITSAQPGSVQDLYLIVSDLAGTRDALLSRGVEVSEVFHCATGFTCRFRSGGADGRATGPAPDRTSYGSFATFTDPDGNGWLLQEVTTRLPGRIDPAGTSFGSASDLASALRRAAAAHGEHEKRTGQADANWPDWYADYMVREQSGAELPV